LVVSIVVVVPEIPGVEEEELVVDAEEVAPFFALQLIAILAEITTPKMIKIDFIMLCVGFI